MKFYEWLLNIATRCKAINFINLNIRAFKLCFQKCYDKAAYEFAISRNYKQKKKAEVKIQ